MTAPEIPSRTMGRDDPGYPVELARLTDAPLSLRLRGPMPPLARAVAIVGTRSATQRALGIARALAADLGRAGCVVVSGGAFGIDRAAHLGALDAGCVTVVVHASGLARRYPAEHQPLYDRILSAGGCELSERTDDDAWPAAQHFLARNRIIAALSRAVVVIEAPVRSGALSTAAHAKALGVPVLSVPRVPEVAEAQGSNGLIRAGAIACMHTNDVLAVVEDTMPLPLDLARVTRRAEGVRRAAAAPRALVHREISAVQQRILDAIERGASDVESLLEVSSMTISETLAVVGELELLGLVVEGRTGSLEVLG